MAKGSKRREKAERDLEEARAKLIELQQRHARTREKGAQRIEQVRQQTEKKTDAAAQRVQRQLGRVTRAEQRLQLLAITKCDQFRSRIVTR